MVVSQPPDNGVEVVVERVDIGVDLELSPMRRLFAGGSLKVNDRSSSKVILKEFRSIQGLLEATAQLGLKPKDDPALLIAGCEFILEGLYAHRKVHRSEERGFFGEEKRPEPEIPEGPARPRRPYQ